jgi:GT2 family glycosyltransferase
MRSTTALSALICTRNRPNDIVRAVGSLLASPEEFQLLVIDQSDGPGTEAALTVFGSDPRLCYVRSTTRGKGAALNEGLRLATGDVVICTDDDCEATPGWIGAMRNVFEEAPTAAVAFCRVDTPVYDRATGYIPDFAQPRRLVRSVSAFRDRRGLGAGMALRRDVVLKLGGFDEQLGPGARFMAADDMDLALRALLSGWHVYNTGDRPIVHHGFRTLEEGREHARRDFVGLGAACAKPLRAGHLRAIVIPGWEFLVHALWPPIDDLISLRRPRGLSRINGFIAGFVGGLRAPLDPVHMVFVSPAWDPRDAGPDAPGG